MPKDLSLWIIQCIVPGAKAHAIASYLEDNGAQEMMVRAYRTNGSGLVEDHKKAAKQMDKLSTVQRSAVQQEWLAKHIKGEVDIKDLRTAWIEAGFRKQGLYGALVRAVNNKTLKKLASGIYKSL